MEDIAPVEDIAQADTFLYDTDIVDVPVIGELARRSVGTHSNTEQLLRYKGHICYNSNINASFKTYPCPSCDRFIKTVQQQEQHLTTCTEWVD